MSRRGDLALAILAVVVFVPLFIFRSLGSFDFWWWLSLDIALLIGLGFVSDGEYLGFLLADLRQRPVAKIVAGILAGFCLYGIFFAGNWLSRHIFSFAEAGISRIYDFKKGASTLRIVSLMILVVGPGEELFWRGFLQRRWRLRFGDFPSFLLTAVLYALVHIGSSNIMLVLAASVCGFFWSFVFLRYKSVLLVAISHTVWDLLIFIIVPFH